MRRNVKFRDAPKGSNHTFKVNTEALWHSVTQQVEMVNLQEGVNPIATFGHLISGYVSQYYSY